MNGVLQLTYLHFAAGGWRRWLLLVGALAVTVCLFYPPSNAHWQFMPLVAFAGVTALFLGATLMPVTVYRLARSRTSCVLPHGRVQLIASAFLATALIAVPLPILIALTMMATFPYYSQLTLLGFIQTPFFVQLYSIIFWICSALFLIQSLFSNLRNIKNLAITMLVVSGLVAIPQRLFMPDAQTINWFPFAIIGISWSAFGVFTIGYPRWRSLTPERTSSGAPRHWLAVASTNIRGQETALLLGLNNRWIQAVSFFVVILLALSLMWKSQGPRLYYLSMYAVIAGAIAGAVTSRSRALWLRCPWSRDEMFSSIERFVWRQMGFALAVLVLWFIGGGAYFEASLATMISGGVFIALTFSACLYLGLLQTRGMRWADASVAIAILVPTMAMAAYASRPDANLSYVIAFELLIVVITLMIRAWVKRRWHVIDWTIARPVRIA